MYGQPQFRKAVINKADVIPVGAKSQTLKIRNSRTKEPVSITVYLIDNTLLPQSARALLQLGGQMYARGWDNHEFHIETKEVPE